MLLETSSGLVWEHVLRFASAVIVRRVVPQEDLSTCSSRGQKTLVILVHCIQ